VLQVVASGAVGGAQQHVVSLVARLDRRRFQPFVVTLTDGPSVSRLEASGARVLAIDEPDDERAAAALEGLLMELRPAVVHNHMYRAEVVGTRAALRVAAKGLPRPFVVSTIHSSRVRRAADRALLARLTPHMDALVAVSAAIERKIAREGRHGARVVRIDNGVDLERYEAQAPCCTLGEEYGFAPGAPLAGVVARLEPEKGHPTLLEAWPLVLQDVPDARLLIVGEGTLRPALEAQAERLRLLEQRRVVFTGRRDDVPAVVAALDVAVLPSYREAQGVSLLEAMALARPIVASAVGGIPEYVADGLTGLLVPPRDPAALAAGIVRLLRDHPLADTLGRAARELVRERFCVDRMVRRVEDLYEAGIATRTAVAAFAAVHGRSA
jgi:glycosyltransferase involved in cell wall biosynthesis